MSRPAHNHLNIGDRGHHRPKVPTVAQIRKVGGHPIAQLGGPADIQHCAFVVAEAVNPWLGRQRAPSAGDPASQLPILLGCDHHDPLDAPNWPAKIIRMSSQTENPSSQACSQRSCLGRTPVHTTTGGAPALTWSIPDAGVD
jgi:hypothetical protein